MSFQSICTGRTLKMKHRDMAEVPSSQALMDKVRCYTAQVLKIINAAFPTCHGARRSGEGGEGGQGRHNDVRSLRWCPLIVADAAALHRPTIAAACADTGTCGVPPLAASQARLSSHL